MAEKKKRVYVTSPIGVAVYPYLTRPDTKFKEEGEYRVKLTIAGADGAELAERIDAAFEESQATAKSENPGKKIKRPDPPYVQEENGDYTFNFKMRASGTNKKTGERWERRPALYDAAGTPIAEPEKMRIGGGTRMKVSFELSQWYKAMLGAGVTLRLSAAQIIELIEWGAPKADFYGFEKEEGFSSTGDADADEDEDETEETAEEGSGDGFEL